MVQKIIIAIIFFTLTTVGMAALPSTPVAAVDACSGSDTAVCTSSVGDLTGGILKDVISILLYIAGTIAVIMIIIGAIRYITSDGDAGKASQAKNTIIYDVVGLVVAVMSFGIVTFVLGRL